MKWGKYNEIDMGYKVNEFINEFGKSIRQLNHELRYVADKLEESIHIAHDWPSPQKLHVDLV